MKNMKALRFLGLVLIGIVIVSLPACAIFPSSGPAAIVGTWKNSLGTVWMIKADRTFDVDLNHDGRRDAWGNYTVSDKTLVISGTGGEVPKGCEGDGIYRFNRSGDDLRFTLVKDKCELRVRNVLLDWHRK
jgi:hypothetical protein